MKSFTKALVLAPVAIFALTACEATLSENQVKERAANYNLAEVSQNYTSVTGKATIKINKRTGSFAKDGIMGFLADALIEASTEEGEQTLDPASAFFAYGDIEESLASSGVSGAEVKINYYSYKSTGLKLVASSSINQSESGITMKGSGKTEMYVLDDGRLEKSVGSIKMDVSGKSSGIDLKGSLDFTFTSTYTWNK